MAVLPFGTWNSPLSAADVCHAQISFQDIVIDDNGTTQDIYWSEMRPQEGGRFVIVKKPTQGVPCDVLPHNFNARTRVHEYGGAAFTVHNGVVYFTNFHDQRLYRMVPMEEPVAITPPGIRFAHIKVTPYGLIAIAESHLGKEPINFLALINPNTGEIKELCSGYDFYASPAISRDHKHIAWICWNHPNMPWDDTQLWVAALSEKGLSQAHRIDPSFAQQSFFQPQWGPQHELVVVSDQSNWWNFYQVQGGSLEPLFAQESEMGTPLWNLGMSTWGFYQGGILCTFAQKGKGQLYLYKEGKLTPFDVPYSSFSQIHVAKNKVVCIAGAVDKPTAVIALEDTKFEIVRENMQLPHSFSDISTPEHITFPSHGRQSFAYYYPPYNAQCQGPKDTLPPLLVKSHGGPTGQCGADLKLEIQYWTSRGFAVVDVNYAGSSGYGRAYRKSLEYQWGIYDVQDCEAVVFYLAQHKGIDPNKVAITGGSAGGYTTLAALTTTQTFKVGASLYGVSDLEALAKETHKFESHYLDRLIGPYPQEQEKYHARSPIYHVQQLSSPVIFFQGEEDQIVPVAQAQMMYEALLNKGIMTKLFIFKNEQHGFRIAAHRITVLEEQWKFFCEVLKL